MGGGEGAALIPVAARPARDIDGWGHDEEERFRVGPCGQTSVSRRPVCFGSGPLLFACSCPAMDFRLLHSAFPFPCIAVHGALSDPRVGPIRHARNTGRAVGTAMHATSMACRGAVVRAGRQAPASGSSSRAPALRSGCRAMTTATVGGWAVTTPPDGAPAGARGTNAGTDRRADARRRACGGRRGGGRSAGGGRPSASRSG